MTAVLCYGDSNTWGCTPATYERMGRWERWPGILQRELGDDVHVIEEGMNGRTTVFDVPFEPDRNGRASLPVALRTHAPLDLVIVFLGTNDLFLPGVNAFHAAQGAMTLAELVLASDAGPDAGAPSVLVLVPPPFAPLDAWDGQQSPDAERESRRFGEAYREAATVSGDDRMALLDLGELVASSPLDGIHFEVADHGAIGVAVAARVRELLGSRSV